MLSCLPYQLKRRWRRRRTRLGIHYFDLTEDVPTTDAIIELSKTAKGLMAPQCGLAPGFVGIVGASLAAQFDNCRSMPHARRRAAAEPHRAMGYAFNWSPEGVVNEYLNDCEVIEGGVAQMGLGRWSGSRRSTSTASKLEAFTTSGGLGTMCETYLGQVDNIDYKTMRYPGHMELMNFFFHELLMRDRRELAGEILTHAKPPVDDDVVYIHVVGRGHDRRPAAAQGVRARLSTRSRWPADGKRRSPGPPPRPSSP